MQGQSGSKKMLYNLGRRYNCPNSAEKVRVQKQLPDLYQIETNSQTTPATAASENRPEQWTRRPVGNRLGRTTSTIQHFHTHTHRCRRFRRVHVCDLLKPPQGTVRRGMSALDFHQTHIRPEKHPDGQRTAFTTEIVKWTMEKAGTAIKHARKKHAQTIGMIKKTTRDSKRPSRRTFAKNSLRGTKRSSSQSWTTAPPTTLPWKNAPTEIWRGREPHSALDLTFTNPIRLDKQPTDIPKMLDEVNEKYKRKRAQHRHSVP